MERIALENARAYVWDANLTAWQNYEAYRAEANHTGMPYLDYSAFIAA